MKAIKFLAVCLMLGLSSANVCAQMTKEQVKEREELKKYSKAELSEKVLLYIWEEHPDHDVIRLLTSWATKEEDIDAFLELL